MNKNYMIYPLKNMRITCRYDEGSHRGHNVDVKDGNVDYPIDDGGLDTGRDPIYCPCDEMKITAIKGVGNPNVTNTIWLVSTSDVITSTFVGTAFMTLTHSNDDDIKDLYVGKTFKRGEIICHEGTDGADANHIHIVCGKGYSDTWVENSNHKWVIKGDCKKPEEVFFVDTNFTHILNSGGISWEDLKPIDIIGTPVERNTKVDQVEVLIDNLRLRESYSTNSKIIGYIRKGIYNVLDKKDNDGYTWFKVENYWIATNYGWTNYYPKEDEPILPRLIFTCDKTGKYLIYLERGNKLYLSK